VGLEAQVVMRLKFHKRSVMKFASRIIQSRYIGIGNYPTYEASVVRHKYLSVIPGLTRNPGTFANTGFPPSREMTKC
jgi:hypothetical protein